MSHSKRCQGTDQHCIFQELISPRRLADVAQRGWRGQAVGYLFRGLGILIPTPATTLVWALFHPVQCLPRCKPELQPNWGCVLLYVGFWGCLMWHNHSLTWWWRVTIVGCLLGIPTGHVAMVREPAQWCGNCRVPWRSGAQRFSRMQRQRWDASQLKQFSVEQPIAEWTGSPTNPKEEFIMRKTKLDLMAKMLNFSLMTSCRLMTISLCQISGGAWWVLG